MPLMPTAIPDNGVQRFDVILLFQSCAIRRLSKCGDLYERQLSASGY